MIRLVLALIIALCFTCPAFAGNQPDHYNYPDTFLAAQFDRMEDDATRVNAALLLLRHMHPDWRQHYKEGVFDCSEMTEYVRYFFRKCGIHADYMQSDRLWHCWLEVPTEGDPIVVECTTLLMVPEGSRSKYLGFGNNRNVKMYWSEIDWWNSDYLTGAK